MKITRFVSALAVLCFCMLVLFASNVYADQFSITWSGTFGNGTAIANATNEGGGEFLITSLSDATQNGLGITLLSTGTYGENDNLIFPSSSPELDNNGFAFFDGTNNYDMYWGLTPPVGYYECSSAQSSTCMGVDTSVAHELTSFSINSVPEPSTGLLLVGGFLGLLGMGIIRRHGNGKQHRCLAPSGICK